MPNMTVVGASQKDPVKIRIAVLFYRFGPYHHARLNAIGKSMAVWALEACGMDATYDWEKVEGAGSFTRVTLTDRDMRSRQWREEVQRKIWSALYEIKPQAVVIPGWIFIDALSALYWCVKTRTPVIVMSDSTAWDQPRKFWKEWIKSRLVKMCSAALAGGTPHADYLKRLGLSERQIFLGYDIVDNDYFGSGAEEARNRKSETRRQRNLPEKYFLASARFIEKKNLFRLVEAYKQYRDSAKGAAWDLVLLGDGPLKPALNELIAKLGLGSSVHLPGFKQYGELPAYFGLASTFIHASMTEQWGLVVNEAMAAGLPVLVSNRCGCAAGLVHEGVNGFTFAPEDVMGIAGLMKKISAADFPLSAFGQESRRIIANWGPDRFGGGLSAAVNQAVKAGPPSIGLIDRIILTGMLRYQSKSSE